MRVALGIEYDGAAYNGWQMQPHAPSVQADLQAALAVIAGEDIRVYCAGRTDTGVHGLGQVVHFETAVDRPERAWVLGTNTNLPDSVAVTWARIMDDDFHARFSATWRRYNYVINARPVRSAVLANKVTWCRKPLNVAAMNEAAQTLQGRHDFSSFRAAGCQAHSPIRTVTAIDVRQVNEQIIVLDITANAFLHHMVRNIAGVLLKIGAGEAPVAWTETLLQVCDRRKGGLTAPPHGLYFMQVGYPDFPQIPQGPESPLLVGN